MLEKIRIPKDVEVYEIIQRRRYNMADADNLLINPSVMARTKK